MRASRGQEARTSKKIRPYTLENTLAPFLFFKLGGDSREARCVCKKCHGDREARLTDRPPIRNWNLVAGN